jgi:hypothetical protein
LLTLLSTDASGLAAPIMAELALRRLAVSGKRGAWTGGVGSSLARRQYAAYAGHIRMAEAIHFAPDLRLL